jgi:hypothetical protein
VGSETSSGGTQATLWEADRTRVPALRPDSTSFGINNEAVIAGHRAGAGIAPEAYRLHWDAPRHGRLLGLVATRSTGRAVNDLGDVAGALTTNVNPVWTPYFYRGRLANRGAFQILPLPAGTSTGTVLALGNNREMAGSGQNASGAKRALHWYQKAGGWTVRTVDATPGGAEALGLNDRGQIVGYRQGTGAMLWSGNTATRLEDLLPAADQADWDLREARDINNRGEIVGVGTFRGATHAFALLPLRAFEIRAVPGAAALDDAGWLAGQMPAGAGTRAAVWAPGAALPAPMGAFGSEALDLSEAGKGAGFQGSLGAVLWTRQGATWPATELAAPPVGDPLTAAGLSNGGHAVGWSDRFASSALFWNEDGAVSEPLAPATSQLFRVNASGHAVGVVRGSGFQPRRYSARDGVEAPLLSAIPHDIDSRGLAVGAFDPPSAAFAWEPRTATFTPLGTLESDINGSTALANGINDRREIVGSHRANLPGLAGPAAFLWHQDAMLDLNLLIPATAPWHLDSAAEINDAGQVLGDGHTPPGGGPSTRFLLTLPSEADQAVRLCLGWCQPAAACAGQDPSLWRRAGYDDAANRFGSCVNGCLAAVPPHASSSPRTLAGELAVRECALAAVPPAQACTANWPAVAQGCCQAAGLAGCQDYFP